MLDHPVGDFCRDLRCLHCGGYVAGLVDGEGCFSLYRRKERDQGNVRFMLKLRLDDLPVLLKLKKYFRCGKMTFSRKNKNPKANPSVRYYVASLEDLVSIIIPFFERNKLRAKKARDFEIWREAVLLIYRINLRPTRQRGRRAGVFPRWTNQDRDIFRQLDSELKSIRKYSPPNDSVSKPRELRFLRERRKPLFGF